MFFYNGFTRSADPQRDGDGGGGGGAGRRRAISTRSGQPGGCDIPSPPQSGQVIRFQNCHHFRFGSDTKPDPGNDGLRPHRRQKLYPIISSLSS